MERNVVITTLEVLRANCSKHSRVYQALDYAISSLKTDEAYQLEYEQPQSFKWCTDCREYDQANHCCHRYSRVIRDTVAELRQEN